MNTFPPTEATTYAQYTAIRRNLAVKDDDLSKSIFYKKDTAGHYLVGADGIGDQQPYWPNDGVALGAEDNVEGQYIVGSYHTRKDGKLHDDETAEPTGLGIHAYMPEIAALYDMKKLSIVSNVGTLIEPTTQAQIEDGTVTLPPFLFSHLHQYKAVGSLESKMTGKSGWAGRLADRWKVNGSIGLNISFTGGNYLFGGNETNGLVLSGAGVTKYRASPKEKPQKSLEDYLIDIDENSGEENNFRRIHNKRMADSARLVNDLNSIWGDPIAYAAKNTYGRPLFDAVDGSGETDNYRYNLGMRMHHGLSYRMFGSFKDTAKMLKLSKNSLGHNRQIFNISEAGFDFHGEQVDGHSKKLRALSMGISDFYKALEEMKMEKEVLVILTSEFGRTVKSNEDGTDHGWGGHSFMLCGDDNFNGGNVLGKVMTNVELDGPNAYTNRARIIPTTSIEQMLAPALDWFGVDETTMAHVLPNLVNFRTDATDAKSAFLEGVFSEPS